MQLEPNPWGLYDMAGNVWEWTCSAYSDEYDGSETRCAGESGAGLRVVRGGSWDNRAKLVRSAFRYRLDTDVADDSLGFRLARTL